MKERITLTCEHIEGGQATHTQQVSIEQEVLKPEDIWAWLPDAFRAAGHAAMGDDLERARNE